MYKFLIILWFLLFVNSCMHSPALFVLKESSVLEIDRDEFYTDGGSFALLAKLDGNNVCLFCHRSMTDDELILRDGRITISSPEEDSYFLYYKGKKLTFNEEKILKELLYKYLQNNPKTPNRIGIEHMINVIEMPYDVRSSGRQVILKDGYLF